ncbi:MAG TPA: hypothetical protein VFR66_09055 [Burkholderiales bacterium]|nr:hypothetical protein [Burkholderiales bacterium]
MTTAFWCVFGAVLLPYISFGIARNRGRDAQGRRLRDNRNPRDFWIDALAFYLGERSTLRSSPQFASSGCVLGLFIVAGLGSNA